MTDDWGGAEADGSDPGRDAELAAELRRRRRRRRSRMRVGALAALAAMTLGFSGLIVLDDIDPAEEPADEEPAPDDDAGCAALPPTTVPNGTAPRPGDADCGPVAATTAP